MHRLIRDALLWHRPGGWRRSAVSTVAIIAATFVLARGAWSVDGATLTDGHAMLSLDMAVARAYCGVPSSFSWTVRIPIDLSNRMERRHEPLRALIVEKAGSIDAYCRSIDTPFVNSENSLMVVETAILRVMPGASLANVGQALFLIKVGCLAIFVLLLMDLGASLALGLATFLCGLMLLQAMPDHVYSNYPFFFVLVLAAMAMHGFAAAYRWTSSAVGLTIYGVAAGIASAFIANMRTSYLPVVGLFMAMALVDEGRQRGRAIRWPTRAVRSAALAGCFLGGYLAFQVGMITSQLPAEGRFDAAHPFAHPLVLALAVPENPLSRELGIEWKDATGARIADGVDPGVPYLGPRYNAALLRYYASLWRTRAGDMAAVYYFKFSVSGVDMFRALRASPGWAGWGVMVLLSPLSLLPSGVWLLALYSLTTIGAFGAYYRRGWPAAFALGLLSLAACLVQVESGMIFSLFVKQYHNYAAFYALFLSLLGVQALGNAGWAWLSRPQAGQVAPR